MYQVISDDRILANSALTSRPYEALQCSCPVDNSSMSFFVCTILPRLDAPNTIDSIFGCWQTYSIASRGGIAPDARTDIAIGRNRRVAIILSYCSIPPHIRNPILLMFAQTIGLSMPQLSKASSSAGKFIVINAG